LNTDELQQGRVTILWNILEHSDGGVIQLIYAGNPDVRIQAAGVIEGQPQIERIEFSGRIKSPTEQYESERWSYKYVGYLLSILGVLLILAVLLIKKAKANYRSSFNRYLEGHKSFIEFYDKRIKWRNEQITNNDKFIEDFKKRSEGLDPEKYSSVLEFHYQTIAEYRKEQQEFRGQIKEYESEREELIAEEDEIIRDGRKQERLFKLATIVVILFAMVAFIPAIYMIFIAQPVGPPFGF
jgi:hypothetical protein